MTDDSTDWDQRYRDGQGEGHAHGHSHGHGSGAADATVPAAELAGIVAMLDGARGAALDLGCGAGADAVYLAELGFDTVGIDGSGAALELAAKRAADHGADVQWIRGDVLALPLEDASMDYVFERGCLHHLPTDRHEHVLGEVARVLKPGGRAFLRDMSGHGSHAHALSADRAATLVQDLPLQLTAAVPFRMGHGTALLLAIRRD